MMRRFNFVLLVTALFAKTAHGGEATAPLCTHAIVEVTCFRPSGTIVLETGPIACQADELHDDCCWLTGESLRLQCALVIQGLVLETRCLCVQSVPTVSNWGLITLVLLVACAACEKLRNSRRVNVTGQDIP